MPTVEFKPAQILLFGDDIHAQLVFINSKLAAIVTRLTAESYPDELRGRWHLEAGFGPCGSDAPVFASLQEVEAWVAAAYQAGFQTSWEPHVATASLEAA